MYSVHKMEYIVNPKTRRQIKVGGTVISFRIKGYAPNGRKAATTRPRAGWLTATTGRL